MNRRSIPPRYRAGKPVRKNRGVQALYRQKLMKLVDEMDHSVRYWLSAAYKKQEARIEAYNAAPQSGPHMATDASPARFLQGSLHKMMRRWVRRFDEQADGIAQWFAANSLRSADTLTRASLRDLSGFTVRFRPSRALDNLMQTIIQENVALIKSIPQQYALEVEGLVMRSVRDGRDLGFLTQELRRRYDITANRAATIARDQNNKAGESIARERMKEVGIRKAMWVHSGISEDSRPSHKHADGQVFDLDEGCLIEGEYIFPGEKINCQCMQAPLIPEFEYEKNQRRRS